MSFESRVDMYSRNKTIKIEASNEQLSIQDFNDKYNIAGLAAKYPKYNNVFYIIYLCGAAVCSLGTITLGIMYIKRKNDQKGKFIVTPS